MCDVCSRDEEGENPLYAGEHIYYEYTRTHCNDTRVFRPVYTCTSELTKHIRIVAAS